MFRLDRPIGHGLRHTFASHFIQNGGNILTLQKILGHSSLAMTMRYAHLAPDHLVDAVRLGPLSNNIFFLGNIPWGHICPMTGTWNTPMSSVSGGKGFVRMSGNR